MLLHINLLFVTVQFENNKYIYKQQQTKEVITFISLCKQRSLKFISLKVSCSVSPRL